MTPLALDWGDVATWFTGIVTSGTLVLGLILLYLDRRRKVWEQAQQVVVRSIFQIGDPSKSTDYYFHLDVNVSNHSAKPIFAPSLTNDKTGDEAYEVNEDVEDWVKMVSPEASVIFRFDIPALETLNPGWTVYFEDVSRRRWKIDLESDRLGKDLSRRRLQKDLNQFGLMRLLIDNVREYAKEHHVDDPEKLLEVRQILINKPRRGSR